MRTVWKTVFFMFACGLLFGVIFTTANAGGSNNAPGSVVEHVVESRVGFLTTRMGLHIVPALQVVTCGPGSDPYTPCLVTLVEPTTVPVCGSNNDDVVFPDQVGAIVEYDSGWVDGTRSITYVSLPGYYIDGFNGRYTFGLSDDGIPCLVTVSRPAVTEVCRANNDIIDLSNLPTGVYVYEDTGWIDGWRTITFAAHPGYVIDGTFQMAWFDIDSDCGVSVVSPAMTEVCGPNNDMITFPEQPEGVLPPDDSGWVDNVRMITYTADQGFWISNSPIYDFYDSGSPCIVTPMEPTQTAVCGPDNDVITIPSQPEGVELVEDTQWVDNVRSVTFDASAGYVIEGQSIFELIDANVPCPSGAPTPSPTITPEPSPTPTATPTESPTSTPTVAPTHVAWTPTETPPTPASFGGPTKVTGLPNTGSGSGNASGMMMLFALGAVLAAAPIVRRSRR